MMKVLALTALISLGGTVPMTPLQTTEARLLSSFIPVTAGPWLSEADQVFDAASIFNYIDGAGEVYRSYNMKVLVARRFHKDGRPDLVVDAFDMGSSEDAFGVFTHDLDGQDAGIGQGSIYRTGLLTCWKGRYFLSVYAEEETAETRELVLALGRAIAAAIPEEGPKPALLGLLPAEGLAADRVRFFHNHSVLNYHFFVAETDVLRLDQTARAVLAEYRGAGGPSRLLVVEYPRPSAAARAARSFAKACMPAGGWKGRVKKENGKWTALRLRDRYVIVAFDEPDEISAAARLDAVAARLGARK